MAMASISDLNADSPKAKLFELLGISKDASVDKKLFDLLVENAQMAKAPVSRMADKVAGVFVPIVLIIAAVSGILWWVSGAETNDLFQIRLKALVLLQVDLVNQSLSKLHNHQKNV